MRKLFKFIIILQFIVLFISNCNILNNNVKTGYVIIGAKFPEKTFNVKKIPDATNIIKLEINSKGLPNGLFFELTKDKPTVKFPAPEGDTIATANAYDINNKFLAYGFSAFFVKPYINNKVEIEMIEVEGANGNTSSPIPSTIETPNVTPTPSDNGSGIIGTASPIPQNSSSPTVTISPTPTTTPSAENNGGGSGSSSTQPKVNTNINVITSTPIPSGITIQ
jgi:hypothetical protein